MNTCQILAARPYISPRHRKLTRNEETTREVAYALRTAESWAVDLAAPAMAKLVGPRDVLVPVPSSAGSTESNRCLAAAISRFSGSQVCNALGRARKVSSSRVRRLAGESPLAVSEHAMIRLTSCPGGRTVLVDNVAVSGGTAFAAATALGTPCVILVWAWDRVTGRKKRPLRTTKPLSMADQIKAAERALRGKR